MNSSTIETLPWLAPAPEDVKSSLKALDLRNSQEWDLAIQLAKSQLTIRQMEQLGKKLTKAPPEIVPSYIKPLKLGVIADYTVDLLKPILVTSALRFGVLVEIIQTDFQQRQQVGFGKMGSLEKHDDFERGR